MSPQADPADRDLVAAILASPTPDAALLKTLEQLDMDGDTVRQARVFEALIWRMNPGEYWVWFRMCQAYQDLKRPESGLFCAARALQIHPDWEPSLFLYRTLFAHFRQRGELAAAFDVLLRQRRSLPGAQLLPAHELAALFGEDHTSFEAESAAPTAEMAPVLARLEAVMRAVFHLPDLRIQPQTTADDVPGWDSIAHAVLLMEVERAFGVTFDVAEALDLESVGALAGLLGRKLTPPPAAATRPKIIVYGNCQAGALAAMLARTPAVSRRFDVVQHDLWAAGEILAAHLGDFDSAEILLLQDVRNWRDHPLHDRLPASLRVVRFPYYYVAALWPFDAAVTGHDARMVRAMHAAHAAGDAFPFGFHDSLIAQLREEAGDPEACFRRYSALEIGKPPNLRRYAELEEARLLAEDSRYGLSLGRHIVDHYRSERLFHAISHPTMALMHRLASEVLARAGINLDGAAVADVHDYLGDLQVPLHPAVIGQLGLTWADAGTRYTFSRRERLTFEEYFRRYIAFPVPA